MRPAPVPLGALRTKRLVGRTKEREAIQAAVEAEGELRVIHIIGSGGIGKSRLLEAIPEEILPTCSNKDRCQWCGIFDLYHTDVHTNSGIEAAIIKALDPKGFTEYRDLRREYGNLRRAGGDPKRLEKLRKELGKLFVQGFNEIATQTRVILCFDTVELIQYESDMVQEVCGIEYREVEVREWFRMVIPQLENTVVIFGGRPKPRLWEDLQMQFAETLGEPLQLQELTVTDPGPMKGAKQIEARLGCLSPQETVAYFTDLAGQNPQIERARLTEEDCQYIHKITDGRPLRIALVSTLVANGGRLPREMLEEIEQRPETVDERLIEEIQQLTTDMAVVLPFMGWTRKGMDSELLHWIVTAHFVGLGWNMNECEQMMDFLGTLPFVKIRPESPLVFLHDEMYDLMDEHVLRHRPEDQGEVAQITEAYYDEQIEKLKEKEWAAKKLEEKMQARREWQRLAVECLYYQLLASPAQGFNEYRRLSDEAIIAHEVGFDMSLRDEMLRFFEQRGPRAAQEQIARDSAIRWVKRFIHAGDSLRAVEVAEKIRTSEHPLFQGYQHPEDTEDPYFTAALLTYQGEALAYLGRDTEAIDTLRQAISLLEPVLTEDDYQSWNKAHVLGRAHNNLGYVHSRERKFTNALPEYDKALEHLRSAKIASLEADTLKNKAMSLARQGKLLLAREFAKETEDIFRSLSMHYGEALTLNTRGLIELQTEEPREAEPLCREALRIFTDLDDARGVGLASIGLGGALRKKGGLAPRYSREVDKSFKEAETLLRRAIDIFTKEVREPTRLVEAYGQLGRIYRDRANLYREMGVEKPEEIGRLEKQAEQNLNTSIELALQHHLVIERADCLEDLAEIYLGRGEYNKAEESLEQSDELIPAEYQITQERSLPSPEQVDPSLWHMLGKNSLLRGRIAFAQEQCEKAIKSNLLAYLYLELYSIEAIEERYTGWTSASRRILHQLRGLSRETLEHLQHYVKRVAEEYGVSDTRAVDKMRRLLTDALQAVGPGGQAERKGE